MFIEQPAKWLRWMYPRAIWRMDRSQRAVYLTFDDGPIPESTPFILDTLKQFGVKATFFMVGQNVERHPELYKRIIDEGHSVGNHTFNHYGGIRHTVAEYRENIEKAAKLINSQLFRPPHGWMRMTQYISISRDYKIIMWDLVTRDYSKWMTSQNIFNNVKRYTRNGSIITFHDSLKSIEKLHFALPESLKWLKQEGYEFKTF